MLYLCKSPFKTIRWGTNINSHRLIISTACNDNWFWRVIIDITITAINFSVLLHLLAPLMVWGRLCRCHFTHNMFFLSVVQHSGVTCSCPLQNTRCLRARRSFSMASGGRGGWLRSILTQKNYFYGCSVPSLMSETNLVGHQDPAISHINIKLLYKSWALWDFGPKCLWVMGYVWWEENSMGYSRVWVIRGIG